MTDIVLEEGFWNFNTDFWKKKSFKIDSTEIYDTDVLIADTSAMNPEVGYLTESKKRKLRNSWAEALPHLDNVIALMVTHQIDQSFFEAICKMKNLKGLYIDWGKVESIE